MFKLSEEQLNKLDKWSDKQDEKVAEMQKEENYPCRPYYGCDGLGYTFLFTPTTLGVCISVRNHITKEEIDLTDYESW